LTNAMKHGQASHIVISLVSDGEIVTLRIVDDGQGFDTSGAEAVGSGLRIMRYRAELIGATLSVSRALPRGTQVVCTVDQRRCTTSSVVTPEP
jgi:signal transduction histidine kinase